MTKKNFSNLYLFLIIYALAVGVFSSFRLILLLTELEKLNDVSFIQVLHAFFIGIRFDIVISGYILLLPFLIFTGLAFFKYQGSLLKSIIFYYLLIVFGAAFFIAAADLPYFNYFFSHFSVIAFQWMDSPQFVFSMIIEEPAYWLYILVFLGFAVLFYFVLKKIFNNENLFLKPDNKLLFSVISIVTLFLILLGIRGRLDEKSPIRTGTAYFSNNALLNQLGLNPNFTFIRSCLDSANPDNDKIHLMDDSTAVQNVQKYLGINQPDPLNPIKRFVNYPDTAGNNYNVVLVIMESMSAGKMKTGGNSKNITPFLDSLAGESYYFRNAYTSGIHTYNGIFSSLFSFPALFKQHPMKLSTLYKYHGIGSTLKEHNYSTIYFTTHDGQFDNVEGFLMSNDFERVVSKKDFPSEEIKTTLGVPDDYLFRFSVPILNDLNKKGKPFFAAFMTASDHGPYYIPEYFNPKSEDDKDAIVEYADYSIQQFIKIASKQEWFDNTIFVFIADHGAALSSNYEIPLTYVHSPLIFYGPGVFDDKKVFSKMAGQIDIYPSLMSLLKIPYYNTTLGIDLFSEERPYIYFNFDDKFGVIDSSWYLIVRNDKSESLYNYNSEDKTNYVAEHPDIAEKMRVYAESNMQTFQYLLKAKTK